MTLQGKTILVTGATDGLGKLVARMLARQGAEVLLHGRSQAKGETVLKEIAAGAGNDRLSFYRADLASLAETRALAAAVQAAHPRLDVLINNAGVWVTGEQRALSADGHEMHFAVNYLAPFLLTHLLLPTIRASAPARIVNVASIGQAPIDFDNVMLERGYLAPHGYRQSKLAQIMFTIDLAERLKGTGVTVTALHPGTLMNTAMVAKVGIPPQSRVEDGAEAVVRLAVAPERAADTGVYYDGQTLARANDQAYDAAARRRLWDLSMELTGLTAA